MGFIESKGINADPKRPLSPPLNDPVVTVSPKRDQGVIVTLPGQDHQHHQLPTSIIAT
jgi:hypothetical protein